MVQKAILPPLASREDRTTGTANPSVFVVSFKALKQASACDRLAKGREVLRAQRERDTCVETGSRVPIRDDLSSTALANANP